MEQAREAMRLEPNNGISYPNSGSEYTNLNRLDEAEAVYKEAEQRKMDRENLLLKSLPLAFLKGDAARMARWSGRHGQAGHGRSAAGNASGHGRHGMGG